MKAILVNDDQSLRWDNVPNPIVKPEDVLVKIEYAALNRADLMQREGDYPPPEGCPDWMGLEISGEIVEVGNGELLTAKQVKELQKRNAQLEEENLILKKAIAIFTPHSSKD